MPSLPTALSAYVFLVGSWGEASTGARESWVVVEDRLVGVGFFAPGHGPGFELLEITAQGYVARPGGGEPVTFPATRVKRDRAVFENPAHDWPTRIAYQRKGDALAARVSGPGGGGGWRWTRREPSADAALLATERARGGDPLAADVSSDGTLGYTVTADGVTVWRRAGDAWTEVVRE